MILGLTIDAEEVIELAVGLEPDLELDSLKGFDSEMPPVDLELPDGVSDAQGTVMVFGLPSEAVLMDEHMRPDELIGTEEEVLSNPDDVGPEAWLLPEVETELLEGGVVFSEPEGSEL